MNPPPATSVTSRLFLGPALRMQPDRRLVSLVRDGYENAFEEIVRRYAKPLGRFAAAIVPSHRAEDVTQDAFSKALLALRHTDKEIELRPWLYRIVRNTALNDLRDQPAPAAPLQEGIGGAATPAEAAERREEIAELLKRLRALPEPQRAAIVMRELEGLSHEEIAAALGLTGGAARQTIYRARQALRDGIGLLIPVPFLHHLLAPAAAEAVAAALGGAAAGGAGGAAAAGGAGAAASAGGAGTALKTGVATVLVAGSVGTGVAINESRGGDPKRPGETAASSQPGAATSADDSSRGPGGNGDGSGGSGPGSGGSGGGDDESSGPGGGGGDGDNESEDDDGGDNRGSGSSGSGSGSSGSGSSGTGSGSGGSGGGSGSSGSGSGSGSSGSVSGSSGSGGSGSGSSVSGGSDLEPPEDED